MQSFYRNFPDIINKIMDVVTVLTTFCGDDEDGQHNDQKYIHGKH